MKQKILFLVATCLMLLSIESFGQQFCNTPSQTSNEFLGKSALIRTATNDNSYCLRVYFHVIRKTDGSGGQTVSEVNQAFQILNEDFNPHGISFSWNNTIHYIDDTSYYNSPGASIYSVNNDPNRIDIYLFDDNINAGGGGANGIGGSSEMYVFGSFEQSPFQSLITSRVISHEMGHVLFL